MKQPKGGAGKKDKKGKEPPNPHIIKKTFNLGVSFEGQSLNEDDTYLIGKLKDPRMGMLGAGCYKCYKFTKNNIKTYYFYFIGFMF
jgi:hypothetical protein